MTDESRVDRFLQQVRALTQHRTDSDPPAYDMRDRLFAVLHRDYLALSPSEYAHAKREIHRRTGT